MPHFGHFTTRDLVHWEKRSPTSFGGATGCVVEHGGKYYFFYTDNQNICLATSADLEQWTQHPGNPLVSGDNKLDALIVLVVLAG
jgi:sucrose-6-phosphate hydrolase SacC (GH32 family)